MSTFLSASAPRTHFVRYLTRTETQHLLATIRKRRGKIARRDRALIRVALHSGFRVGSLAGLTLSLIHI